MKIFRLEDINTVTLESFITFSNENWDNEWNIYVDSVGGNLDIGEQILYILNLKKESCSLNISYVGSKAFHLMYDFKGEINILRGAMGMFHLPRGEHTLYTTGDNVRSKIYHSAVDRSNVIINSHSHTIAKAIMTPNEYKEYLKGEDIWFSDKQLIKIIKNRK